MKRLANDLLGLAVTAMMLTAMAGCGKQPRPVPPSPEWTPTEFVTHVRSNCTKPDSRTAPRSMRRKRLHELLGVPRTAFLVDARTQRWAYPLPDGQVYVHVMLEAGQRWDMKNPWVFVDLKRVTTIGKDST